MVWLYRLPIPVKRRRIISSFKWFLPAFVRRRGRGRRPVVVSHSVLEFLTNLWGLGRLSYRPARLHSLAELVPWNWFLGSLKVYLFVSRHPLCKTLCTTKATYMYNCTYTMIQYMWYAFFKTYSCTWKYCKNVSYTELKLHCRFVI